MSIRTYKLSDLEKLKEEGRLSEALIPVDKATGWGVAVVKDEALKLVNNGVSVKLHNYVSVPDVETDMYFLSDRKGNLLAFAKKGKGDQPFIINKLLV